MSEGLTYVCPCALYHAKSNSPPLARGRTPTNEHLYAYTYSVSITTHMRNAGKWTVVAFLNSGSGGGMGQRIMSDMVALLGSDFVFDLKKCGKGNMPDDNLKVRPYTI